MILVVGTVRVPEGAFERAREAMDAQIDASRAEPRCIRYAYARDVLDPNVIHVSEAWRDREALKAHFAAPHMAAWRAVTADIGFIERDLRLYETSEGEPI